MNSINKVKITAAINLKKCLISLIFANGAWITYSIYILPVIWQVTRTHFFPAFLLTGHLTPSVLSFYNCNHAIHGVENQIVRKTWCNKQWT